MRPSKVQLLGHRGPPITHEWNLFGNPAGIKRSWTTDYSSSSPSSVASMMIGFVKARSSNSSKRFVHSLANKIF